MNVWHVYARHYNFGDHALGIGVRNLLHKYFERDSVFKTFDTHGLYFDRPLVERLNGDADLLVVGGGGLIHEFGGNWMFHLPDRLIQKVRVPILVYGIGYNYFRGEQQPSAATLANIRLLSERALAFTIRNDGSQQILEQLGLHLPEVPDPGFFIGGDYPHPGPAGESYVVIQLANDMRTQRGFQPGEFLPALAIVIRHLLTRNYRVLLTPHVKADVELSQQLVALLPDCRRVQIWDWATIMRDEFSHLGLAYYRHARFVIGMRGHAQICPIGLGVPVLTVGNHEKHRGLLRKLGLDESYYAEATDPDLAAKLIALSERVEVEHGQIRALYLKKVAAMEAASGDFLAAQRRRMQTSVPDLQPEVPRSRLHRMSAAFRRAARKRAVAVFGDDET